MGTSTSVFPCSAISCQHTTKDFCSICWQIVSVPYSVIIILIWTLWLSCRGSSHIIFQVQFETGSTVDRKGGWNPPSGFPCFRRYNVGVAPILMVSRTKVRTQDIPWGLFAPKKSFYHSFRDFSSVLIHLAGSRFRLYTDFDCLFVDRGYLGWSDRISWGSERICTFRCPNWIFLLLKSIVSILCHSQGECKCMVRYRTERRDWGSVSYQIAISVIFSKYKYKFFMLVSCNTHPKNTW